MRKDWKYILYVGGAIALYVMVRLMAPKQYDWTVTFSHTDKNPFGGYVLYETMPELFKEGGIDHHFKTIYEVKDSLDRNENVFILALSFSGDKPDTEVLLKHAENGGNVFISAQNFWGVFADTLNISTRDYFFQDVNVNQKDSSYLKFANVHLDTTRSFWFNKDNIHNYFERFDTLKTTVIAKNSFGDPVTIRIRRGKGNLFLNSTPLAFTNIYLLTHDNYDFVSGMLSVLPKEKVSWTEYYQRGRLESSSPLRYILTTEPLAWAYYLTLFGILLFMIFEAKRKQRIIPVVKPLANTSLEFVSTIGNLYYQKGDHKNLADKKIAFLLEYIRSKYLLKTSSFNSEFFSSLSKKSGKSEASIQDLFRTIVYISSSTLISDNQLMDLNEKIENFLKEK